MHRGCCCSTSRSPGLDLPSQETILRIIDEEVARGAAVVFSTHHLEEAKRADRVMLLAGCVIADGAAADVLRPEHLAMAFGGRLLKVGGRGVARRRSRPRPR